MTDEGQLGNPIDAVEMAHAMKMFSALKKAGFTEAQALKLVAAQIHGISGGRLEAS